MADKDSQFPTRGGVKLEAALDAFGIDVAGAVCADFGCNVGGFTHCLLRRGAAKVYAIDTGYGCLAWTLRKDDKVVVMERTNALYCEVSEPVDLVVIDLAWTPQKLSVPAATKWLKDGGRIVSLVKPHYELEKMQRRKPSRVLTQSEGYEVCQTVCRQLADAGFTATAAMKSTLAGKGGNTEFLLLIEKGK